MNKVDDKTNGADIPKKERPVFIVVVDNNDDAVGKGGDNAAPEEKPTN